MVSARPNKIILFDFDGVIVESFDICYRLNLRRYPDMTRKVCLAFSDGNVYDNVDAWERAHVAAEQFDFFTEYAPLLMKREPMKGIEAVLHVLAGRHPLIIVSSTIESPIGDYLSKYNLSKYFAEILGFNTGRSKVEKIQDVVARYGVKAQDVVFVTDTLGDLLEANEVGVRTVAVTWGFHERERLQKGSPTVIVEDPAELLGALEDLLDCA